MIAIHNEVMRSNRGGAGVTLVIPVALLCASCSTGGRAETAVTAISANRPEVVAVLRSGTSSSRASSLASSAVTSMGGVAGSRWSIADPVDVFFFLSSNARVGQIARVVGAVERHAIVRTVRVSIPGGH